MLGAHPVLQDGNEMWHFAVWAPNAQQVSLVGTFCGWNREACPMIKQFDGTWEVRLPAETFLPKDEPDADIYTPRLYKYAIRGADGSWCDKADPYGFRMQLRPGNASLVCDLSGYEWQDGEWMNRRPDFDAYHSPLNIYELHLASWRRRADGTMLRYGEIADQLIPYIKEMGYTHIELMPVMEHPLDGSWGYQTSGYFAATSRYGEPQELMAFVDRCHQAGIGVILDWVPAHFPKDEAGLRRFDGTACYEHPDPRRGEMPQWGTCMFDFARGEVRSFLLSSACFWLEWFHADGLRVDAVSAMLYLDFGREHGQWLPNRDGGKENWDAVSFLQTLNATVYRDFPGAMTIAEESTAWPMVTKAAYKGGLGFGFKWNMGWMNDLLAYVETDFPYRSWHHGKLTFSMMYAFSEDYILALSHDETVHGKRSLLEKQPGDLWRKFAGLRAMYGYAMAHPGKKLLFMGGEFGQFIEWDYQKQLDWMLLEYERHPQLQACVRQLNALYRTTPALYQIDDSWDGFQWVCADDKERSVTGFIRRDREGGSLLCVTNWTPAFYPDYRIFLPKAGSLTEILNTDSECYGGSGKKNPAEIQATPVEAPRQQSGEFPSESLGWEAAICVPPLSTVYFLYRQGKSAEAANNIK